jgi:RimJ/RimL family protein N-acetyltransferase
MPTQAAAADAIRETRRALRQSLAASAGPIAVLLRDGRAVMLRPALPADVQLISEAEQGFSDETVYRRFMSRQRPSRRMLMSLFDVDFTDHFAWVLTDPTSGVVVAEARYVRDPADPLTAEVALSVADAFQGAGAGTVLIDAVAVAGDCAGVRRFTARTLVDNTAMRRILNRFEVTWSHDEPGIVSASFDVPAVDDLTVWPGLSRCIRRTAARIIGD